MDLFVLFLVLFVKTDYSGVDELHGAVNLLLRIDPLLALTAMLAAKTVVVLMLPALATVALHPRLRPGVLRLGLSPGRAHRRQPHAVGRPGAMRKRAAGG